MSAPRMSPSGTVNVTSHALMEGRLELFGYGADERLPNPGDLLIVTTNWTRENGKVQEVEFALRLRGRDMHLFVAAAQEALTLWKDNEHWLSAPSSKPGLDTRAMSEIRAADSKAHLVAFLARRV